MATIAKKLVTNDALTFQWADETFTTIKWSEFNEAMNLRAMQHGYSQKLGDSYSGAKSVTEAKAKLQFVLDGVKDGDWNQKGGASGGIVVEALAKASNSTFEDALAAWTGYSEEKQKVVAKDPAVVLARKLIELDRAKAKVTESDEAFSL